MTDQRRTETTSLWSDGHSAPAPIGLLAPGTALGERYEIREVLGHGGFAVVYLARDRELGRDVALKVLREDRLTPGSLSRLKREVRVARDLAHPNLLRVYDIESAGSAVFLTLEPMAGGSLRDQLRSGPMPVEVALPLALQIFRGLDALHGVGIVHRDIKPGNVLLTEEGGVKLADFGLALHLEGGDTRVTATETAVGTLEYLSPEQAMGEEVDVRSDLYSAGVVLFEMLAGRLPHEGRSSLGNLIARFREHPPDLALLRPDVPRWLARVVARLLARDRRKRYPSAAAVLHDLERRRARLRPNRRRTLAAAALVLSAAAAAWVAEARGHRFSHLVHENDTTMIAVDRRGRTLWRRERTGPYYVPVRLARGGPLRIATIPHAPGEHDLDKLLDLAFLDPQTGETVDRMRLLGSGANLFPGFARTYGPVLTPIDVDGDGGDELVVVFNHSPYWPSFAELVEPALRRTRPLLIASGHHFFRAAQDLDGDGRAELLFAGINNRMGWRIGVAAVRVDPWIGEPWPTSSYTPMPAGSLDRFQRMDLRSGLLWYAVAPRRLVRYGSDGLRVDPAARTLTLSFLDGSEHGLDFDGFAIGRPAPLPVPERQRLRFEAFAAADEASRIAEGDQPADALPGLERAADAARRAGLDDLGSWIRQLRLRVLVIAGRDDAADRLLEEAIAADPLTASEVAFEAARGWHRRGELDRALAAYRRSTLLEGASNGRGTYESLQGQVLALLELGRSEEVFKVTDTFRRARVEDARLGDAYDELARWFRGEPADAAIVVGSGAPDLQRYWQLEIELSNGADPATLLPELAALRKTENGITPLLDSLEAELLHRLGRDAEARPLARKALTVLDRGLPHEIEWRAHRPLVAERAKRLGGAA